MSLLTQCCSDGVPPYAEFALPDLVVGQPYDISLQLTVPASPSNLALGNFMTSLSITTLQKDDVLAYARKPVRVPVALRPECG